ncbi:uncharacterized protein LAJ45_07607 [Morchella importuna]|uniref:uncharacterized protein n=1 Tax=Morchella importuna TaxID=1174673 RepID=UPI001E8DC508|nr:uncharacterized protein LAJ45_07607 [Morchella importuna]KAH8148504.1 hypothetical protein LAJ45_07607 [Morchella importuna]
MVTCNLPRSRQKLPSIFQSLYPSHTHSIRYLNAPTALHASNSSSIIFKHRFITTTTTTITTTPTQLPHSILNHINRFHHPIKILFQLDPNSTRAFHHVPFQSCQIQRLRLGASRYERVLQAGVCGRANCSYYEHQRPSGRWASGNSSTTPNIHINFDNFGVHPKGPSPSPAAPKPTPEIPMPTAPKPYLYDMRECRNYSQGPYTSIDDNADYDFTLDFE